MTAKPHTGPSASRLAGFVLRPVVKDSLTTPRAFLLCSSMWAHRQTIIAGRGEPDDREVLFNGRSVGRVYYAANMLPDLRWFWVCGSAHGHVETMAEALECVRRAYLAALEQNATGT